MGTTDNTSADRKPWARSLPIDAYLDVLDTANKWSEAVVIGTTQHKVHVHFRGWSARYNEWLPFESPRLAPAYTRARNWRALNKGDRVQLATEVSGVKSLVWRDGTIRQTHRGHSDSDVLASVLVQLDGDRETRWVDTEDDSLCAAGTHQLTYRAAPKRSVGNGRASQDDEEDDGDDEEEEEPETIVLSDDDDESGEATTGSSDDDSRHANQKQPPAHSAMKTRGKRPLTLAASKPAPTTKTAPFAARARRDDRTNERTARKRKHDDDDDFATWREGLAQGVELEVADKKLVEWYEARVCEVRGKREVCVRFRGWPWRYDEWLPRTSERLAPSATHLGRWRNFMPQQPVQIGFRARAKAEAPSQWETGVVTRISRSKQTRQVKRVEIEWEDADGETMSEWREANDDLLAPVGIPTYPLPKKTDDPKMSDSGGPAFGGAGGGDDNEEEDDEDDDDGEGLGMALELPGDQDEDGSAHEPLPPSLADMLTLTPADIAKVIESQPAEPLADAPTAPSATPEPTTRQVLPVRARQKIHKAITEATAAFNAVMAAVDAAFATAPPLVSVDDNAPPPEPLEPQGQQQQQDDTDDTQAAPMAKRARQKHEEHDGVDGGGITNGTGGAAGAGPGGTDDACTRVQPAEI